MQISSRFPEWPELLCCSIITSSRPNLVGTDWNGPKFGWYWLRHHVSRPNLVFVSAPVQQSISIITSSRPNLVGTDWNGPKFGWYWLRPHVSRPNLVGSLLIEMGPNLVGWWRKLHHHTQPIPVLFCSYIKALQSQSVVICNSVSKAHCLYWGKRERASRQWMKLYVDAKAGKQRAEQQGQQSRRGSR